MWCIVSCFCISRSQPKPGQPLRALAEIFPGAALVAPNSKSSHRNAWMINTLTLYKYSSWQLVSKANSVPILWEPHESLLFTHSSSSYQVIWLMAFFLRKSSSIHGPGTVRTWLLSPKCQSTRQEMYPGLELPSRLIQHLHSHICLDGIMVQKKRHLPRLSFPPFLSLTQEKGWKRK